MAQSTTHYEESCPDKGDVFEIGVQKKASNQIAMLNESNLSVPLYTVPEGLWQTWRACIPDSKKDSFIA